MSSGEDAVRIIGSQPDHYRRVLALAALLTKELGPSLDDLVVVGGSAIEVLTQGGYVSGDVDLVGDSQRIIRTIEGWGFKRSGRLWGHPALDLMADAVGDRYTGDRRLLQELATPFGPVKVAAVEDLIVKRLVSCKHWRIKHDIEDALLLARTYDAIPDWRYIERRSKEELIEDTLEDLRHLMKG